MRAIALFSLTFATAALLGQGSARATAPASESCLASCTAPGLSADDQATCRLQCARLAQSAPATPPPAARPPAATPPATSPPATSPPASSPPRPAQPAVQPAPDLAHKKFLCESQCDAEPNPGDRATCRLQCGQLARVSGPQSTTSPVGSTTVGNTTTYSFAPGGGSVPVTTTPGPSNTTTYSFAPGGGSVPVTTSPGTAAAYNPQAAQRQQQIAACQASCDREASATDRATCRNNCGAVGTVVGPAAPSQWVLGPAPTMTEAEQRAAVIRSSGGVVPGSAPGGAPRPVAVPTNQPAPTFTAPQGQQPQNPQCAAQAQSCKVGCAGEQTTCSAQCDQGKMSETDRATCKLTCSSSGDMCRDDCRMKEAACKPAVYR
ncbi:hypothetical protein [Nannocystis punicea]|uniref:Uncharacterized protein n=1 Tax=Nannocystis punicea TaxID=2995304 RepID=A0ABY7H0B9_9BACT|nr:hypothetical protein [Nannocystis poenicansa]WAS92582.1 hypothetical protein O0S08_40905 [Nannocystis poenicansa]